MRWILLVGIMVAGDGTMTKAGRKKKPMVAMAYFHGEWIAKVGCPMGFAKGSGERMEKKGDWWRLQEFLLSK